jgi:hypothetical protein
VPDECLYDYAIIRIVPRVERGEQINAGVVLSCVDSDFLEARTDLDEARLRALDPGVDLDAIRAVLTAITRVCAGGPDAGPLGTMTARERFRWVVSPRSTIVQLSPIHTGRTADPAGALQRLFEHMVLPDRSGGTAPFL